MHEATPMNRSDALEKLTKTPLDVLVIGGGIVGAGVVRDAAMRGLRAGLIEQHDFAFGTSSRSSRLLHGGLRYLAQGRIGLVREASVEKRIIHTIAPHIAAPLAFVFPTYRGTPWAPWALWKLRIGVKIYDLLCGGRNLGRSSFLGARELREYLPGIREADLTGAVRYYDGLTNDARLVIDTLRSAARAGALLLNYCRLEDADPAGGAWSCFIRDVVSDRHAEATARCIVNATGPWAAQLRHSRVRLRLTKGVHLVIDRARLPVPDAVVMTEGNRILFAIPWGERVILGTTDTDYDGPIEAVRTDPADIRYILRVVNGAFPQAGLARTDVISSWAGLRPLIADPDGRPSDISRAHEILSPEPGWWDVAGGKLTTYRLMAEQTVDRIVKHLRCRAAPCATAGTPLLRPEDADDLSRITPPAVTPEAVRHYCRHEWAVHLDDVMVRRTSWHYYHRDADRIADRAAGWMGEVLGWTSAQQSDELERYRRSVDPAAEAVTIA